jgi:hypothetical protein
MLQVKLDDIDALLDALPPPPTDGRKRRKTRQTMEQAEAALKKTFLFIGEPHPDEKAVYALIDVGGDRIRNCASNLIVHSARNEGTLIKVNMSIRDVNVVRTPQCLDRGGGRLPKKTNCLCWWCRGSYNSQPVGCPFKVSRNKDIHTIGMFCSFECALAFANDSHSHRIKLFAGSYTLYMRKLISGTKYTVPLLPAPHWTSLKEFGGPYTREQFHENAQRVVAVPQYLPLFPLGYNLFLTKRSKRKHTNDDNIFERKKRIEKKKRDVVRKDGLKTTKQKNYRKYAALKLKLVTVSKKKKAKSVFRKPKKSVLVI